MEVTKVKNQETGRDEWHVTQEAFIKDLLLKDSEEIKKRKIPITRDQALMPAELEENRTSESIRDAQKAVGEMLWLVTRSRPDLMFSTARIGANATKHPSRVMAIYQQLKGYLKATEDEGLVFSTDGRGPIVIEALADASFSPDGEESHGAFSHSGRRLSYFLEVGKTAAGRIVDCRGRNDGDCPRHVGRRINCGDS